MAPILAHRNQEHHRSTARQPITIVIGAKSRNGAEGSPLTSSRTANRQRFSAGRQLPTVDARSGPAPRVATVIPISEFT